MSVIRWRPGRHRWRVNGWRHPPPDADGGDADAAGTDASGCTAIGRHTSGLVG